MPPRLIASPEELRALVGQEVGVSAWVDVPQALIDAFADVSGDRQWIHTDPDRAARDSPYGTTIAHGFLTLALVSRLHRETVEIAGYAHAVNYGLNRVRFPAPVPAGSRLRGRSTLQAVEAIPGGLELTWQVLVEREGTAKPVLVAEWVLRLYEGK